MNEFEDMIKIGELADKKMADEIVSEMLRRNIHLKLVYVEEFKAYVIFARDKESASLAFDYYRVKVGLAPPPKPMPEEWNQIKKIPLGSITLIFLAVSIFIFVSKFFATDSLYKLFFISENEEGLTEIARGEYWRVLTPVFLHFNLMHIFFNGMWMKDLGSLVEHMKGKSFYLLLLISSGVISNFGQFYVKGPFFGGLSGIVYALLGFVWMNKKFYPESEYSLPRNDVILMIGWFFLCFTGLLGPIANTAHGMGLAVGMLLGIISGSQKSKVFQVVPMVSFMAIALFFGAGTFAFEFFVLPMITKG